MPNEWQELSVDEIKAETEGAIAIGPFGSRMKSDLYTKLGVPVIRGNNISDTRTFHGEFVFVSDETADEVRSSNAFPDDLVFPHRGAIGEVGIVPKGPTERYVLSTSLMKLTCNRNLVEPLYVFYFFRSDKGRFELLRNASTVGTPGIAQPLTSLKSITLSVPALPEQRAIAHILGTLDDKIELNRRMNETLEAMARALFKSWFVDFDPVRAKMEGRDTGLPKHIADLIPSRFVPSELGEIPEGWTVESAGSLYEVGIGKTPPRMETQWFSTDSRDLPWISIKDLGRASTFISEVSEYLTPEAVERFRIRKIPDSTTVLSFKLTIGRVAITDGEMLSNEAIAHFLPRADTFLSSAFLFCYLRQFDYQRLGSTSSIATAVNSDSVRGIPVLVPSRKIHDAFVRLISAEFLRIRSLQRESRNLGTLRDTLLPKLISGELSVDAKRFLEIQDNA